MMTDEIAAQLVGWGRVVEIETRGRNSGRPVAVAAGYVEDADGSLLVAAGSPDADWARNLEADSRCRVTLGKAAWDAVAESIEGPAAAAAVAALILRYGTPAEGLGRGPVFRLRRSGAELP
ncbi:MAG TPA: nitroreductase family deazaflavin-dependent oxidoreductase [Candidatus Limnocylindrales bacterium]|nr:nitroreductase family deazaflavin-dependent oxidoreductase [Candidatus Limnocylindrales bacterium]